MSRQRPVVSLVPLGEVQEYQDLLLDRQECTLKELLAQAPALTLEPVPMSELGDRPLRQLQVRLVQVHPQTPLFWPAGMALSLPGSAAAASVVEQPAAVAAAADALAASAEEPADEHPESLAEEPAVRLAYHAEIERIASFLRVGLSALVACDKLVVRYLWRAIAQRARLEPLVLDVPAEDGGSLIPRSRRQMQLTLLRQMIENVKDGQVIVLPHLDLLAGGGERGLAAECREITELLYEEPERPLLAFVDRSLPLPEVLAARFAVRPELAGLPRDVLVEGAQRRAIGVVLVTRREKALFRDFKPAELFKQVAGMNPVQLRHALAYAEKFALEEGFSVHSPAPVKLLYDAIRAFKAQTSEQFTVPDVKWSDIGGYDEVKAKLQQALAVMAGAFQLPNEELRTELIPRGFLLYGPPGTGKTLFAKAVANQLNATIRVVSGPEVTDMYVGESERKLRAIFAEARRNAPSVVVFDEFDSIAASRSSRDDGGSRAGNALVAQILTEMDGFRPDVPMLVIGTTNRLNLIDEALLRPSRFQPIAVGLPDEAARRSIGQVHARHFHLQVDPELLSAIGEATHGFNGDQIRSLFRDACVGAYCAEPPQPVTAERLGFLVGRVRATSDEQRMENQQKAATQPAVTTLAAPGARRPNTPMTRLDNGPRPPGPPAAPGPPTEGAPT